MQGPKRDSPKRRNISNKELFDAMQRAGWLVPETVGEVARAEAEIDESSIDRPTSFEEPLELLSRGIRLNYVNSISPAEDARVTENLARAAREGSAISPTVEQRMKSDRDSAQSSTTK